MEKCRIVIDGVIFGLQKAGGITRLFMEIIEGLDASRHEIIVLIPKNSNIEWQSTSSRWSKVKIIKRKKFKWGKSSSFLDSLYLTFMAWRYKPHIWHSSYYVGVPSFFCKRRYLTYHDMIGEVFNLSTPYETKLKYDALKKCDSILAISHHSYRDLIRFWPEFSKKTSVLHNGLSCETVPKMASQPYFLFLGKRRSYKNFLFCAQSILKDSRFNKYTLKVVGGEKDLTEEEKSLSRVEWLGVLPYSEIKKYLSSAAALLFPSLYEGFGFPVLEAFQHGTLALSFNTSSIPEITGNEYPLIDPAKPEMVCDVLEKLLNEREKWVAYGKTRGELFTVKIFIEKLMNHYAI